MNSAPLLVTDPRLDREAERITLSARIDEHRLFWTMPDRASIALRGEPFVCALLVSAMRTGRSLVLPEQLSLDPAFHASLEELQVIFARWFAGLRPVTVEAALSARHGATGRFTGYSGGVDSSYTVLRLLDRLDGVVLVDGIEYQEANVPLMREVDDTLAATMAARGLPLLTVQTNAKWIGKATGGKWSQFIGGSLASAPHALGVAEYSIASSNAWEKLRPYGSHPITDPRWSSASTSILHHGCEALRVEKISALRSAPDLLAAIRVCFQGTAYNCGTCHKCLQTAAGLRAVGLESPALPVLRDPTRLRSIEVEHDGDLIDWEELLTPAVHASDPALAGELSRLLRRYHLRQAARRLDEVATGGWLRRLVTRT
jgi:hypothetical protein